MDLYWYSLTNQKKKTTYGKTTSTLDDRGKYDLRRLRNVARIDGTEIRKGEIAGLWLNDLKRTPMACEAK